VILLSPISLGDQDNLKDQIILISIAVPGYDWIFSKNIKGFITIYCGVNSHMAIRCAELSLPVAIGVGPIQYTAIKASTLVEIDCLKRNITVLK
jgi:glutamine kinase